MGSFSGYSVSVGTFEIVRLFFNGFFSTTFSSDVAIWWIALLDFFFPRRRTWYSSPCTYRWNVPLPQDFLDVIFLVAALSTLSDTRRLFFLWPTRSCFLFPMPEEDLWCLKKTRCLNKPDEAFHTRRHRPWRLHQEFRLVAPRKPIWLSHTHFAWQTKLWLSEDVSVRFNQNLLKRCIRKYYIRLSG